VKRDNSSNGERIRVGLARLDETTTTYERKWGVGRLQGLVDQDLAEAFERQLRKLNAALTKYVADEVLLHIEAMIKGWRALDAAAETAGAKPIDATVWEITTPDGRQIAFVSDVRAYKALKRDGWEIWSADEVGNIIDKFNGDIGRDASGVVRETKRLFPGAEITGTRSKTALNDEIPF
jgi:hypothetical protein